MISIEDIRNKISELITNHEPEFIESIDVLMKKWERKENDLLKTLCEKYEETYVEIPTTALKQLYIIGPKIGLGTFSVVRKCRKKDDGTVFALKIIDKKKYGAEFLKMIHFEVSIMRQISHPNIVTLYDVFYSGSKICLVIDFFRGGTLFNRINEKRFFSENEARKTFTEMVEALKYLHNKYIVHRDIKLENVLFVTKDVSSTVKLIDFGFAHSCKNGALKTQCGTPQYSAPEILKGRQCGTPSDMWSIGVILFVMLCGFLPFNDKNLKRLYRKVIRAEYDMSSLKYHNISKSGKDLVKKLLEADPRKRLTAKQTLEHNWFIIQDNKPKIKPKMKNIKPSQAKRFSQSLTKLRYK